MKALVAFLGVVACLVAGVMCWWGAMSAYGSVVEAPRKVAPAPALPQMPVAAPVVDSGTHRDPAVDKLGEYLKVAALGWMKLPTEAHASEAFYDQEDEYPEAVAERIVEVASQIAEHVSYSDCLWPGSPKETAYCAETGLLLMSIALHESRFRGYVDDGRCNDRAWRRTAQAGKLLKLGTCDAQGDRVLARSLWQMHNWDSTSRPAAIAEALERVRKSIRLTGNLSNYTGEPDPGNAPKARERLMLAREYARKHPFDP